MSKDAWVSRSERYWYTILHGLLCEVTCRSTGLWTFKVCTDGGRVGFLYAVCPTTQLTLQEAMKSCLETAEFIGNAGFMPTVQLQ